MNLKWLVFLDQLLFRVIRISGNTRAITKTWSIYVSYMRTKFSTQMMVNLGK